MLAAMRTTAQSFVMKLLMVLLVISFAVWGVGDIVRSGGRTYLVKVGDETVGYPEFARRVNILERMMQSMGVAGVDRQAVQDQVLRQLVEEKLIALRLKEIGLSPNEDLLAARLKDASMFHDIQGKFDPKLFRATLAQRQMSEAMFLEDLKADIRASAFTASIATEGMNPPPALLALQAASTNERRDAVVVSIPASSVSVATPDEGALKAYYESNKEMLYLQPERRTLEYVSFPASALESLADKAVTSEAIAQRKEEEPDHSEKDIRAELKAEQMETIVDDVTVKIEDALAAGDTMGQAVAAAGIPAQSQMLKDATAEEYAQSKNPLLQAVAEHGFSMEDGETSNLEVTSNGQYYMVAVKELHAAEPKPYDAVKADVVKRATAVARAKAVRARAMEVKDALEAKDWEKQLAALHVSSRSASNIRRPETGTTSGVPSLLAQAVFEHEINGVAGPLMEDTGNAMLARVTAIHPGQAIAGKSDPKATEALSKQIDNDVLQAYYRALSNRYPIHVNEALMQQIRAQEGGA